MKKHHLIVIALGIYFLFLIQLAGTLVESIYILDLMNTTLDEKALGLLFFFSPILLLFYRGRRPALTAWLIFGILFLSRGLTPYLPTLGRMLASGAGAGAALALLPFLLTAQAGGGSISRWISPGLALAVGISALLRTVGCGLDYSLLPEGGWTAWALGLSLGAGLTPLSWPDRGQTRPGNRSPVLAAAGILLVIGLAWFAFSAPAVITRWTEGDYRSIVSAISLLTLAYAGMYLLRPGWIEKVPPTWILIWNLIFTIALTLTILAHRVPFPGTPEAAAVVVGASSWMSQLPLVITLLLFPVIFLDLQVFAQRIQASQPGVRNLVPGVLLGSFTLVVLVFMQIFSNVWGYVEPISPWFRNKFWLPYALLAGLIAALIGRKGKLTARDDRAPARDLSWGWLGFLAAVFLGTAISVLLTTQVKPFDTRKDALTVMTFNIQQANDNAGERSYREQLALIQQVDPDILALQESDSARIALNNNDYVRYYASKLGYHSYYGPRTVTGTYGTAILSRYPLLNTRTVFSYSDQDEIGTAAAEVEIGREIFTIYNVHPDGSEAAMLAWAETVLQRTRGQSRLIILGDYNLRDYEEPYQRIAEIYTNAWESVYPAKISPDGTDMSGENRIDHIFISPDLEARDPVYVLPPESATDHPVHWAEITWE